MTTLYGIGNCDTVRKARRWLEARGIEYRFHDVRKDGLSRAMIRSWLEQLDWQDLINTRGTTWRKLSGGEKTALHEPAAIELMLEHPAIIKRPLLEHDGEYLLGFGEAEYAQVFG